MSLQGWCTIRSLSPTVIVIYSFEIIRDCVHEHEQELTPNNRQLILETGGLEGLQ